MPGLTEADRAVWRYVWVWPNTAIDLYPDQVMTWQVNPRTIDTTHDVWHCAELNETLRARGLTEIDLWH